MEILVDMCSNGKYKRFFLFIDYKCLSFWFYNNYLVYRKVWLSQLLKNEVKYITFIILYILLLHIIGANKIVVSITARPSGFFL